MMKLSRYLFVMILGSFLTSCYELKEGVNRLGGEVGSAVEELVDRMPETPEVEVDSLALAEINLYNQGFDDETIKERAPDDYYSCVGYRDWFRRYLVYPYSIQAIDLPDQGTLCDDRNATNIKNNEGVQELGLRNICELCYDDKLLLAHCKDRFDESSESFALFNFETQNLEYFDSMYELRTSAEKQGYSRKVHMINLEEILK